MKTESLGFSLSPGEPDEIDLELASIGAVGDPAALSKIARAAEGPLRQAAAEITAYRLAHEATARPLRLPNRTPRRWTGGAGWALAAAAGLLLAVAAVSLPAIPNDPGFRAMGGLPVDVVVRGADGAVSAPDEGFQAGDELFLRLRARQAGVVEVVTVEADGDVSVIDPGRTVRPGEAWSLGGAARLDDQPAREWLVVTVRPSALDPGAIEADARGLLPDPPRAAGATRYVLEVTRRR